MIVEHLKKLHSRGLTGGSVPLEHTWLNGAAAMLWSDRCRAAGATADALMSSRTASSQQSPVAKHHGKGERLGNGRPPQYQQPRVVQWTVAPASDT